MESNFSDVDCSISGIGRGIVESLAESGEFQGILLTYNTNREAAEIFLTELNNDYPTLQVEIVGGDLSQAESRDRIFTCFDQDFAANSDLCLLVHNAGQYAGITSENSHGLEAPGETGKRFGDGSLVNEEDGQVQWDYLHFYQKLYAEAYIDLCERSLVRMKQAHARQGTAYRGCLIGISSPGCNQNFKITSGYDMPGSGKCVMEFANRYFALRAAPLNINVNVIIPGVTVSDAWGKIAETRGSDRDSMLEQMKGMIPMQQVVEARHIGDVVAFLASTSGGGKFMTGLSLRVDGGLHLT